ncbi:MAG: cysteine desulfurase-like protein [Actinomycetota bacterium]|nr:cysteine desulfurase-like protein [Actinomycetota bacterium]
MGAPDLSPLCAEFPGLARTEGGRPVVFADAPGGSQVPLGVIEAMAAYLRRSNANLGGPFATSVESGLVVDEARRAGADLLGATPGEIVFGANTTTVAFHLAHAFARTLSPRDEVVVTRLDHDANVAPWVGAATAAGATVRWVDIHEEDCTLDLKSLDRALSSRTRLVAFTVASNAVGTIPPAAEIVRRVHDAGALAVADGVHFAQHGALDAATLGADVLFTSAYKFFGPHLGVAFISQELLERWRPDKVRPLPDVGPERWETGTQNHEALAGMTAAVDYLADVGERFGRPAGDDRRARVVAGMEAIRFHEAELSGRFLEAVAGIDGVRLWGIADPTRVAERTPTFAVRVGGQHPRHTSEELARRGVWVWDGNYFALEIMERLGLQQTGGTVRIGFCHYNTGDEVDRVLAELDALARMEEGLLPA